jgi:flagellar P-ring protein precursor FlgI
MRDRALLSIVLLAALGTAILATPARAQNVPLGGSRLKDVVTLQGPSSMPVIGYGLVVGLNKTGDRRQTIFSAQTLASMLERFGVAVAPGQIKIENVAAVMVTTEVGPYNQLGSRLDVTASSIGDARSLQGGTLLPTPLRGPDGNVIAIAQGALSLGGFGAAGAGASVTVNHLTVGRIPRGAQVQVARTAAMPTNGSLRLAVNEPDFMSAKRIAQAINAELGTEAAHALDAGTVSVDVPQEYQSSVADLVARIEPLPVSLDSAAKVVINERTGTVVLGGEVRIGPAAVAHGALAVRVQTNLNVSQPAPFSQGQTTVTPSTTLNVDEGDNRLVTLPEGSTLADVVKALNTLGATPRDIIAIMQALKAAGALRAEVVVL